MIQFPQLVLNYVQLIPYALLAFLVTLLVVPLVGKLAYRIGAIDRPRSLAGRNERNLEKRISTKVTARPGGLAMVIGILFVVALSPAVNFGNWGVIAGILVLTVVGLIDDTYDLPPSYQFISQIVAASLVVIAGSSINSISIAGEFVQNLNAFSIPLNLGPLFTYTFVFPAHIITVIWIVAMINFVNWASGIDALNGGISAVAALAFLLIAMQTGQLGLAILIATHLGSILGVLPFNYYPSKIFYGLGESVNGFLLAVYAISGEIKFAGAIIVLGLPLVDAAWVALNRIRTQAYTTRNLKDLIKATLKSDRSHLHHRLLELGYSWKGVLLIEVIIMSAFATFAFYMSGFSITALQVMVAVIGILAILAIVSFARNRAKRLLDEEAQVQSRQPRVQVRVIQASQEEKDEDKFIY